MIFFLYCRGFPLEEVKRLSPALSFLQHCYNYKLLKSIGRANIRTPGQLVHELYFDFLHWPIFGLVLLLLLTFGLQVNFVSILNVSQTFLWVKACKCCSSLVLPNTKPFKCHRNLLI